MTCPHCGNEWDVSKSPCSSCGLLVRLPGHSRSRNAARQPSPLRPRRFVTGSLPPEGTRDTTTNRGANNSPVSGGGVTSNRGTSSAPLGKEAGGARANAARSASAPLSSAMSGPTVKRGTTGSLTESSPSNLPGREIGSMAPGTMLRSGRYWLRELLGRHEWTAGVYEAMWIAKDVQRPGAEVMICEFVTPEPESMMMQSVLRAASVALSFISRHPRIPTLCDAFKDQGRGFFVFELFHGESLLARMRRSGRTLSEQDVMECCLQMIDILELLAQHNPPLIHGLLRPEHVMISHVGLHYILTNFSVALAGGATQVLQGLDHTRISPYMAPEVVRGIVDVRSDLYSLLATAYYAITGSAPVRTGGGDTIPSARRLNATVSPQFDALLTKGLRYHSHQRYQRPAELRQALLAIRSAGDSSLSAQDGASPPVARPDVLPQEPPSPSNADQALPYLLAASIESEQEHKLALPDPDELPPMEERDDKLHSMLWLGGVLVCLILLVYFGRGLL